MVVKHRQLASVVNQERASRHHVQQKYFAEVEHRTAMAEEVADSRESEDAMRAGTSDHLSTSLYNPQLGLRVSLTTNEATTLTPQLSLE